MSLIDPLTILYSNARATKSFGGDQDSFINGIKKILVSVGWTLTESIPASATITYPLGAPVATGPEKFPKDVAGCAATPFLGVGGANFTLYNPYTSSPAAGPCTMVPAGDNPIGTLSNLATAVTFNTPFNALVGASSPLVYTMTFTAKVGGPDWNGVFMDGNGRWGTQASAIGGGFKLTSKADPEITQYSVRITFDPISAGGIFSNLQLRFNVNGGDLIIPLSDRGTYTCVANGHGFFLKNSLGEGGYPNDNFSLFVMAPKKPAAEDFDPSTSGVFILGPRTFENFTFFYGSGSVVAGALDNPFFYFGTGGWPKLLAYRNPGTPLVASNGKPIVHAAYIGFTNDPNSNISHLIGKLPDCAVISTNLTPYGETEIDGQIFAVVGSQDGSGSNSASSFLMMAPLPAPDPVPPAPDPVYPDTQPQQRSGTCNIFGSGVTALTGNFTGLAVQSPITVDGIPYFIDSVQDSTHLTLTTATVIKSGVVWTVP